MADYKEERKTTTRLWCVCTRYVVCYVSGKSC